jgi:serine protease Do
MRVVQQLKTKGKVTRGWLGVLIQGVTRGLAESFGMSKPIGALVADVVPDSPAAKSDLKPGDVIIKYNGRALNEMSDLPPMVGATPVGDKASLQIIRNGQRKTITVVIGELPPEGVETGESEGPQSPPPGELVLGMRLENLGADDRKALDVDHGVKVTDVADGPGKQAGIQPGDVLVQIRGQDIKDVDQLREIVKGLPGHRSVPVLIKRKSRSLFLALRSGDTNK